MDRRTDLSRSLCRSTEYARSQLHQRFSPWLIPSRAHEHFFELFFSHAALLRPELLYVQAENARPLCEVINVAAGFEKLENIAVLHSAPLRESEFELVAVCVL